MDRRFAIVLACLLALLASCADVDYVWDVTPTPLPVYTVTPTQASKQATRTPMPTRTPDTFTVLAAVLNVRNADGDVVGRLKQGEPVSCYPSSSGWCMMEDGNKVWGGCLEPNEKGLECKAKSQSRVYIIGEVSVFSVTPVSTRGYRVCQRGSYWKCWRIGNEKRN